MSSAKHLMAVVCAAAAIAASPGRASATVTFDGPEAERKFTAYVAFLERDPAKYARELATLDQLERSDVEYRVRVGGSTRTGVDGELTTDGERVLVFVSDGTGPTGKGPQAYSRFSERACFAHELEHARQFDSGEFAFERDPTSRSWHAERPSFDIGDERRAWEAQLRLASNEDFWRRPEGSAQARPSLMAAFAAAKTDAQRVRVLLENGYGDIYAVPNCVAEPPNGDFRPGQLVRPNVRPNFFGRVPR